MAKSPKRRTFADLVTEPTWSERGLPPTGRHAVMPGRFNRAGQFFDQDGALLELVDEDVPVQQAHRLILAGASVVSEGCGCGGTFGGCTPTWVTEEELGHLRHAAAPAFTGGHGAPSWIDVWANDQRTVVFAHGDLSWGSALP